MIDIELLKYPIGKFQYDAEKASETLKEAIFQIEKLPDYLEESVADFSENQFNTPYRPGGWTVCQLIHHLADSHMNALIRFKLALTEINPVIKPYDEAAWAEMSDYDLDPSISLSLVRLIHKKWAHLLNSMETKDFERTYFHPENQRKQSLFEVAHLYSWHSQHHLAHIQHLVIREKWTN